MSATLLDGPRVDGRRRARVREPEPSERLVWTLTAVAVLPIVVAVVRAVTGDWLAVGDNANVLIRARDVLTSNHPLLGPWSSASIAIGEHVNHPGPLLFDLLAPFARLGDDRGLAVGVGALNGGSVVLAVVFARRAGGVAGAIAVAAASAGLAWTMGSSLLHDPWNPHIVLFPFLLVLVLVWAMAVGDVRALPVAAGAASLVVQTHGSHVFIVPALCAVGLGSLVWRRRWDVARPAVVALVVLAVAWAQPVVDQVSGEGNLAALARGMTSGGGDEPVGVARGVRITADVLAIPPWWGRPSFDEGMRYPAGQPRFVDGQPNVEGLPSAAAAVAALGALGAVLAAAVLRARRRGAHDVAAGLLVCGAAVVIALVTTVVQPVGPTGLSAHLQRYLWPLGALLTSLTLVAVLPQRLRLRVPAVAAVVLAALALPANASQVGSAADAEAIPVVRDLAAQLARAELPDPVLVATDTRYAEPWTSALMATLQGDGVSFTVTDEGWARQIGTGRRDDGDTASMLFFREGAAARVVPDGARRVAFHDGLTEDERVELGELTRALRDLAVVLDDDGRAALAAGGLPTFAGGVPTTASMLRDGTLAELVRLGLVLVPRGRAEEVARYAELQTRAERQTVAVFVGPVPS